MHDNKIKITDLKNCYIEFSYNGIVYSTTTLIKDNSGKILDNSGNALEIADLREQINATYAIIEKDKAKKNLEDSEGKIMSYRYLSDETNQGSIFKCFEHDTAAGCNDCSIKATTRGVDDDKILGKYTETDIEDLRKIDNAALIINLGLYRREQPDLALGSDIDNVEVNIKGYSHIYKYGEIIDDKDIFNVKAKSKFETKSYERQLYKTDCLYSGVDELDVYVTHKIRVSNESNTLISRINKILDYYDSNYYEIDVVRTKDKNNQIVDIRNEQVYNSSYKKVDIELNTFDVGPGQEKDIYIVYKLINYKGIVNNQDGFVIQNNYSEIASYSTFDGNGKKYAGIDKDSNPGNYELNNHQYLEDDTSFAPSMRIDITGERKISGTVFLDEATKENLDNNERLGDGIFNDGEQGISNVKVELYESNQFTQPDENGTVRLIDNAEPKLTTTTGENGEFTLSEFVPGDYRIVYIWGDNKYTTYDYKGTIWTEQNRAEKNQEPRNGWYRKDSVRYTDAKDSWEIRKNNGTIMESSTNVATFAIERDDSLDTKQGITNYIINGYQISNIDFGIIERPKQSLTTDKKISKMKVTLANGQTVIDAELDDEGNIIGDEKDIIALKPDPTLESVKGLVKLELDSELIQGSTVDVTYKIIISNNSEKDYFVGKYYLYGDSKDIDDKVIKLNPDGIYDYLKLPLQPETLGEEWVVTTEENYNKEIEEFTLIEEYFNTYKESEIDEDGNSIEKVSEELYKKGYFEEKEEWTEKTIKALRQQRTAGKTILNNNQKITLRPGEKATLGKIDTQTVLVSSKDEMFFTNEMEITKIEDSENNFSRIKLNPVELYKSSQDVTITTPTGKEDYTIEILSVVLSGLTILGVGILFIKKCVRR